MLLMWMGTLCTYYAVLCLSVCWTGKQSEQLQCDAGAEITLPSRMKSRLVWRTLVDLLTYARGESCNFWGVWKVKTNAFFGWKLRGLQIIFCQKLWSFFLAEKSPRGFWLYDCLFMQQRFDNLVFCTKIYKKVSLQIGEAIFYFFSSSLVLFASSDSCKKICVRIHIIKMWHLDYTMGLDIQESICKQHLLQ